MFHRCIGRLHAAAHRLGRTAMDRCTTVCGRLRDESGQGTVEYVALILIVAAVLAVVVTASRKAGVGDGGIGKTIVTKLREALESVK